MATHPARRGWSYAEFRQLPDDGNRYEVIDGDLYVTPAPRTIHQKVSVRLAGALERHAEEHGLGVVLSAPCDVIFGEDDYLQPDIVFIRRERDGIVTDVGVEGAPDLVVEIASPATAVRDRGIKRHQYAAHGVPEYWIIDTDARAVERYRLIDGELRPVETVTGTLEWQPAPGSAEFAIDVAHLTRPATDYSPPR
ncbi:MAG TPA: Uma2 family endonuclease [Longimicrobium sp.]|jgi:Uma2 family endonuclease|uniref:Uma2 family endonuclease n=1 Tax=Longimicrobium sp. TaxID=2029185 RepID=UPI002EDB52BF